MFLRTRRGVGRGGGSSAAAAAAGQDGWTKSTTKTSFSDGQITPSLSPSLSPSSPSSPSSTSQFADVGYMLFNMFTSIAVTFVNEAVFSKADFGFPSILCLNGFIATYVGTEILRWFDLVQPIHVPVAGASTTTTTTKPPTSPSTTNIPTSSASSKGPLSDPLNAISSADTSTTTGVTVRDPNFLVLILVVGLSKTLNNVSLKYNSMGVYQIFKLLVTPAIVALEYCLDGRVLSGRRAICLAFVCLFCVGSINGDLQISTSGLAWATVWLPFAAIFKVQWARVKRRYNCSTVSLMNAVMPYACFLQLAIAPVVDPPGLFTYQWTLQTVLLLTMSAFGAFFVLYSSFLVLGHVGPLSHTLLGPLKTATTMMGSAVLFKTRYSATQLITATGALLSLAAYTHVTVTEQRQHKQEQEGIPLLAVSSIKSTEPSSNKQVDNGDDTVTTAASTSSNGDEEDPLILLTDEEDKLPDHEMDDSDRTFV